MLLSILYLLVRRILGLAVLAFRTDLTKDAELLVLRTRTPYCVSMPGGSGTSQPTGCGSLR